MHRTDAGEEEGLEEGGPRTGRHADELKAEAEDLKEAAKLEDLHLWQMEKTKSTKKGTQSYLYWMASWRDGGKVRHVHLGAAGRWTARQHC